MLTQGGTAIKLRRTRDRTEAEGRNDLSAARRADVQMIMSELEALTMHRRASTAPRHSGRLLGSLLVVRGFIVQDELDLALARQRETGRRLGEIVVELGLVRECDVIELLAEQLRLEVLDLARAEGAIEIGRRLSEADARRLAAIPFRVVGPAIAVAVADPTQPHLATELTQLLRVPVRIYVTTIDVVQGLIDRAYGGVDRDGR